MRDAQLEKEVAPYAGEKGHIQFQLDEPIPYKLLTRTAARGALFSAPSLVTDSAAHV